jgi:Trypsin-like peptidase domain
VLLTAQPFCQKRMGKVSGFLPSRRGVVIGTVAILASGNAMARRAIPDDNLAYPVLITLRMKNGGVIYGSGFYLNTPVSVYLVTAKHVLFAPSGQLVDADLELISYTREAAAPQRITLTSTTSLLSENNNIKAHPTKDVAVIKVGSFALPSTPSNGAPNTPQSIPTPQMFSLVPGWVRNTPEGASIVGVAPESVKTYDQVLVGNDVIMYGYPRSLVDVRQLDPLRPLLRRGLIAGLNEGRHTIVIDCPSYRGNSGGPAVEIEPDGFGAKLKIIGVVVEFVALTEGTEDFGIKFNSGYSIVEPMDSVLELTK